MSTSSNATHHNSEFINFSKLFSTKLKDNLSILSKWLKVQKLNEKDYFDYFEKSKSEGLEYSVLQVNDQNQISFQFEYRKMYIDVNKIVKFSISSTSNPLSGVSRPLMVSKEDFVSVAIKLDISKPNIEYFFSDKMKMTDEDWNNY